MQLQDVLEVSAWIATALAALNWGLVEVADTNLLSDTLGLSGSGLGSTYVLIGVLGVVDLALLVGKLDSGVVTLDEPVGLAVAVGTGVAAVNWGTREVFGHNLLTDTLGLSDGVLSGAYIAIGALGVLSLYWLAEDLTGA